MRVSRARSADCQVCCIADCQSARRPLQNTRSNLREHVGSVKFDSCSDEQLALESQRGSLVAFEALVLRYERRIYRFVAQWCRDGMDASEITQETFVRAYQNIGQFKSRYRFSAWLFTIARHKSIDHHRAAPIAFERQIPEFADTADPAQLLEDQEQRVEIWNLARRSLPELQFQALWLRYVEDMQVKEVAKVLRKTQMHVKVLLFRARRTMAAGLAKEVQSPKSKVQSQEKDRGSRVEGGAKRPIHVSRFTFQSSRLSL
ncbi:MAG: hypothetical protein C5B50_30390 [Verrucomicrobia bacterium]|nr:MAG: hypothetical protein C5B50_30390 [Verrucomicrobiota bacterium]